MRVDRRYDPHRLFTACKAHQSDYQPHKGAHQQAYNNGSPVNRLAVFARNYILYIFGVCKARVKVIARLHIRLYVIVDIVYYVFGKLFIYGISCGGTPAPVSRLEADIKDHRALTVAVVSVLLQKLESVTVSRKTFVIVAGQDNVIDVVFIPDFLNTRGKLFLFVFGKYIRVIYDRR